MNKKLIAVAVSSALAAPVIAQAEGEVKVYGRINQAISLTDASGSDSDTDVSTVSSRFGIRYDNDLGNGLAVHGRYEFDVRSDNETGITDVRIGTVGISGAFGRFDVGNQWSAYFNTFGTFVSPTYTLGYYLYSSIGGGPFRASNTLKYSNTFGPVNFQLDARLNGSDEFGTNVAGRSNNTAEKLAGDGIGVGISFDVGDYVSIGLAADYEDGPDSSSVRDGLGVFDADDFAAALLGVTTTRAALDTRTAVTDAIRMGLEEDLGDGVEADTLDAADITTGTADLMAAQDYITSLAESNQQRVEADPSRPENTTRYGIAVKVKLGELPVSVTGGWQNLDTEKGGRKANGSPETDSDVDTWFLWFAGSFTESTSWLLGYADSDNSDAVEDADQFTWGIYHTIGGGLRLYYEGTSVDNAGLDGNKHLLGLRIDF